MGHNDGRLIAYDARNGDQLWEFQTGAGANATATVFERDGKQYVMLVSAGSALGGTAHGDSVWLLRPERRARTRSSSGTGSRGRQKVKAGRSSVRWPLRTIVPTLTVLVLAGGIASGCGGGGEKKATSEPHADDDHYHARPQSSRERCEAVQRQLRVVPRDEWCRRPHRTEPAEVRNRRESGKGREAGAQRRYRDASIQGRPVRRGDRRGRALCRGRDCAEGMNCRRFHVTAVPSAPPSGFSFGEILRKVSSL